MSTGETYWYMFTHYICAICGRCVTHKRRVRDRPRPDGYSERHVEIEVACNRHF